MSTFWWVVLALVLCALAVFVWSHRAISCGPNVPALPGALPIVGNLFQITTHTHDYYDWMTTLQGKGGTFENRTFGMSLPGHPPVLQAAPNEKNCRHILKDNFDNYPIGQNRITMLAELMGSGIFGSNGKAWRAHRKSAANIFTLRLLRDDMTPVLIAHGTTFVNRLHKVATAATAHDEAVDMQDLFFRHTMDSFVEIAFGERIGTMTQVEPHPFSRSFDVSQYLLLQRFFDPLWKLKRWLGVGAEREIATRIGVMNAQIYEWIARRRADIASGTGRGAQHHVDLITHFLAQAVRDGRGDLTDNELRDSMVNFLVAGRDTTAVALSWFWYELGRHERVKELVQCEVDEVMRGAAARNGTGDGGAVVPDFQSAADMTYTEAALLECLRLHPPVPGDDRTALHDDVLPDGTPVKAGTAVGFNPYQYGHSAFVWGDTVDQFLPERWTNGPDALSPTNAAAAGAAAAGGAADRKTTAGDGAAGGGGGGASGGFESGASGMDQAATHLRRFSQYQYPTFSGGLRLCMGRGLALLEAKLLIAQLMHAFTFTVVPGQTIRGVMSITMSMTHGIKCVPKVRTPPPAPAAATAAAS